MPINAHPDYLAAEREYHEAQSTEEKIEKLKKMISVAPKHKGSENLLAQLRLRLKKFQKLLSKEKKKGKKKSGIKKEDMQVVLIGLTNRGKSSLLKTLTNAEPKISDIKFTTKEPVIGMLQYKNCLIQLIENPPIESDYYDKGLTNSADTLLLIVTTLKEIKIIEEKLSSLKSKKIIVFNKSDLLSSNEKRKISANLQSNKYIFSLISTITKEGIDELKEKIFSSFNNLRVFTKEPGKNKSAKPVILSPGSTVKDIAEKIFHGFSKQIKQTKIWGPSSKFPGQIVGLNHKLKDLDIIEFKTK